MTTAGALSRSIGLCFAVAAMSGEAMAAAEHRLAVDGQTHWVVVTPAQPTPKESTAAERLGEYLGRVTGAELPVRAEGVEPLLWSDIAESPTTGTDKMPRPFVLNIEAYPQADSATPTHVSSPWLIGRSSTWHSGYFAALRLRE